MTKNVRLIYLHNFLTDFRPQWAFLAIYCAQITGSYTMGMAVLAVERISSALVDIPTGIISDKIGRKSTIVIGSICTALMAACYAFAHNPLLLFIGAILSGLGSSFFSGNNDALLYESLKSKNEEANFHHYQGQTGSMFQLGLGLSALLASAIVGDGIRLVFMVGIIPQILSVIVSLFFEEPKTHIPSEHKSWAQLKQAFGHISKNRKLRLLTIANAICNGAGEAHFQFITVFIQSLWPLWGVGIYRALNHALGFSGFQLAGRLLDRFKAPYVLVAAESYWFATGCLALVLKNSFSPIIYLTDAGAFGPFSVARDKILQEEFNDQQRATLGSVVSFTNKLFYGAMLFLIGLVADRVGIIPAAAFAIGVEALSLPIYIRLFKGN